MLRGAFVLWFGWVTAGIAQTSWTAEAATQLAARISSLLQRRTTVSLEFQNLTTMAPADSASLRSALEDELKRVGLEMAAQPESRLRVTVSENPRGLLFAAEAITGESRQVALLPWNAPPRTESIPRVRIDVQAVTQQLDPLLDLLLVDSAQTLLCLSPTKISMYHLTTGKWTFSGVTTIPVARPPARDPRGRIENASNGFRIYLPGTSCNGTLPDVRLTCAPTNELFPVSLQDSSIAVRWVPDRNVLESDGVRARFYSAGNGLFDVIDGRVKDRTGEVIAGTENWGSDVTSIESGCGAVRVVLSDKAGDHDTIQAYEVANGTAAPVSSATGLPGPVTALWPAETPDQATLVIHNMKTGTYEASRVRAVCAE